MKWLVSISQNLAANAIWKIPGIVAGVALPGARLTKAGRLVPLTRPLRGHPPRGGERERCCMVQLQDQRVERRIEHKPSLLSGEGQGEGAFAVAIAGLGENPAGVLRVAKRRACARPVQIL